jgi:hypothetical protein
LDGVFRELKISPHIELEVENDEAVERAISRSAVALSFLPKGRASQDRIHVLRIAGHEVFRSVGFASLRSKQSSEYVSYFSALCCEQARHIFPSDCLCNKNLQIGATTGLRRIRPLASNCPDL